jgi:hypothetical protein
MAQTSDFRAEGPALEDVRLPNCANAEPHCVACERGGIRNRLGSPNSAIRHAAVRAPVLSIAGKKFANFMILKLALDFLVEVFHSIPQELHVRALCT